MGGAISLLDKGSPLGGVSSFKKGSYVRIPAVPENSDSAEGWVGTLENYVARVGLVVGGGPAGKNQTSVAFVRANLTDLSTDRPVKWYQCQDTWLEQVEDEEAHEKLSEQERGLLAAFFEEETGKRVREALKDNCERDVTSLFGPTGTFVRVRSDQPSEEEKRGVAFSDEMEETLGACGVVIKGCRGFGGPNVTYVFFPLPVGNAYAYSDEWLEKVDEKSLTDEETEVLCAIRDLVVKEKTSFVPQQKTEESGESLFEHMQRLGHLPTALQSLADDDSDGDGDEDNSEGLFEHMQRLNRLKTALQNLTNNSGDGDGAERETTRSPFRSSGGFENIADQLRESHRRELDLTRRLAESEARETASQERLARIEGQLNALLAQQGN